MLPEPGSDPPELCPPGATATPAPEPACTTVPHQRASAQLSQRRASWKGSGCFSAGTDSPVSADSSHSSPAVPEEWVSLSLAVTTVRASSSPGNAGNPADHGRDLAAQCPDGDPATIVCWLLD